MSSYHSSPLVPGTMASHEILVYGTVRSVSLRSREIDNSSLEDDEDIDIDSDSMPEYDEVSSIANTIYDNEQLVDNDILGDDHDEDDEGVPFDYTENDLMNGTFWRDLRRHGWIEMKGRQLDINYLYVAPKHNLWNRARVLLQFKTIHFIDFFNAGVFIFTNETQVAAYVRDVLARRAFRMAFRL